MLENNNTQHNTLGVTVKELSSLGIDKLPQQFISAEHLIYSSPASLSFNSPGAEGFGVKRAALSIPGSVLLLISPGCCGRNTSGIGKLPQYENRFFFLNMDESDIVTGRHLKKVPDAVEAVINEYALRTGFKPSVVMICITCVDALLGTDMERVCRKAEEKVSIPVRPCYMYALTREGRKPPMVHVRQSLYSLLEARKKRPTSINLLGHFAPLIDDCELYDIFRNIGIKQIREISRCRDYDEFQLMAEANFNVVLDAEARPTAVELEERLKIPYIELKRLYQIDKVERQYAALAKALNVNVNIETAFNAARAAIDDFKACFACPPCFAVGEFTNGDPFELALSLIREGFKVPEIFGTISPENFIYTEKIAELSPETKVYSNLDPGIIHYNENAAPHIDFAIGKDAAYYHPHSTALHWKEDVQPFGFAGIKKLYTDLLKAYKARGSSLNSEPTCLSACAASSDMMAADLSSDCTAEPEHNINGLRCFLPPFAPDASGASSVLYSLGGITVICDAGGCAGNICGFDEPRWLSEKSAIYSAGLRDMDAILGRDDRLVEKLKRTVISVGAENVSFAAVIGTPVPAVIATDYLALKRMCERRIGIRTLCVDTNGMELYDVGAEKAYMELFRSYLDGDASAGAKHTAKATVGLSGNNKNDCAKNDDTANNTECESAALSQVPSADMTVCADSASSARVKDYTGYIGILGATLLDTGMNEVKDFFCKALGTDKLCCLCMEGGIDAIRQAGSMSRNIVIAPSALNLAEYLKQKFGTPYEIYYPGADMLLAEALKNRTSNEHSDPDVLDHNIRPHAAGSHNDTAKGYHNTHEQQVDTEVCSIAQSALDNAGLQFCGKRVLIVHQHVLALSLAEIIKSYGAESIETASWFKLISGSDGTALHDEGDLFRLILEFKPDIIISDGIIEALVRAAKSKAMIIDIPHFAVSGRMLWPNTYDYE